MAADVVVSPVIGGVAGDDAFEVPRVALRLMSACSPPAEHPLK